MSNSLHYDELYHHGIKGQKWGVRRFQNKDGTYTSAGKRRRNSEDQGSSQPRARSGVGKKIATGLAIGAAAGLAAYGLSKVDTRKISDAIWTRKMTAPSVSKLREFTVSPKVKEFVEKNGQKALGVLKESAKRGGKAMADAAIASIGAIAVAKITSKITSNVNTGNADIDRVIKDTTSAVVNAAFNTRSSSSGNKYRSGPIDRAQGAEISKIVGPPKQKEIDRSGPEYQALFKNQNGDQRDPDTRGLIKSMASAGYGVDQISTYLDKLDKGEIRHSMYPSELYHHGIKGQKWGVRRFQNEDGTLTRAGQLREQKKEAYRDYKNAYKQANKADFKDNSTFNLSKNNRSDMANAHENLRSSYRNYLKVKNDYKYEKAKEKGASEKKLEKIRYNADKKEAIVEARGRVEKAINDSYASQSTGRLVVNRYMTSKGHNGGLTSATSVAALQESGMTKKGARAISILVGERGATDIAYVRARKEAIARVDEKRNR